MLAKLLVAATAAALYLRPAEARVNATNAFDVFLISNCDECTADKNSIFCTDAEDDNMGVANYSIIGNNPPVLSYKFTIRDKKNDKRFQGADGSKYCWEGTFGKLLNNEGFKETIFETKNVRVNLDCSQKNLFYRQCVIDAQLAIVLMSIGSIVFVCGCTCCCFYCGCCKCCNNKGDTSKWGCFNRFCPSAPCADPPEKDEHLPEHMYNPKTEEENLSSLFGKNDKLNTTLSAKKSLTDLKKPGAPLSPRSDDFSTFNPTRGGTSV